MIKTTEDRYNGLAIDNSTLPKHEDDFKRDLIHLIDASKDKSLLWIEIPIDKSEFIPIVTKLGFQFHH